MLQCPIQNFVKTELVQLNTSFHNIFEMYWVSKFKLLYYSTYLSIESDNDKMLDDIVCMTRRVNTLERNLSNLRYL